MIEIESNVMMGKLRKAHIGAYGMASGVVTSSRKYAFTAHALKGSCGSMCVSVPLEWDGAEIMVDGGLLERTIKGYEGIVKLSTDGSRLIVSCGKSKTTLKAEAIPYDYYPETPEKMGPAPDRFATWVKACLFKNKSTYDGVVSAKADGRSVILSTNSSRICYALPEGDLPTFWLGTIAAEGLYKLGDNPTELAFADPWLHARYADGTTYSTLCKDMAPDTGNGYPVDDLWAYIQSFLQLPATATGTFPEASMNAIAQASLFSVASSGQLPVNLHYTPGNLHVSAEDPTGSYEEDIEWDGPSTPFSVAVDAIFVKEMKLGAFELLSSDELTVLKIPGDVTFLLAVDPA